MPRFPYLVPLMGAAALWSTAASAHPHVWVTAKSQLVYDEKADITAVRHSWTFDEAYSSYATQGLDTDGDGKLSAAELTDLAKVNVDSLSEFNYFTKGKANGKTVAFANPTEYNLNFENGRLTLNFTLPVKTPMPANRMLTVEIYDGTYFVAFTLADGDDAATTSGAPKGCATQITRPKKPDEAQQQQLSEAFFEALTANANFGMQFSNRILVACP
ncbi:MULTISPECIES: DUF1007 family protein [unclassified Chelatococcus]|uniref:DUF1007 family protein n=1 Tax=unclassified Chelatococcus TaxID=2638111 RepID=UPI001BCDA7F3|nr:MULTISPECIES: DUF1007 family protein [unclassified Chelatococcus]MBS7696055.1 DUF1007 family protein [Chelatococcus sp. YT9]MBX3558038.1 DUF1007 family protein [Chelatococcus sp.]